ncbi:MAG: hypothetical protein ACK5QH_07815 [Rubrivivax sp.]
MPQPPVSPPPASADPGTPTNPAQAAAFALEAEEPDLVMQMGAEVAATLSSALERVNLLATTGQIDRSSLRALREELESARRAGMVGQQLRRLASGQVRLSPERLDLSAMLHDTLRQRGREITARGLRLREQLQPAEVRADLTLCHSLVQTLLDWALAHACSRVDLAVDLQAWPPLARLRCRLDLLPPDQADQPATAPEATAQRLNTLGWRLLEQTAVSLGLVLQREDRHDRCTVLLQFPDTVQALLPHDAELPAAAPSQGLLLTSPKPLVGSHVLVLATRRDLRNQLREALRPHGLMLDFVTSVEEAREFCRGGLPHALVHEAQLGGDAWRRLRQELLAEVATLAFVQITDDGHGFQLVQQGDHQTASVGRHDLAHALPAALAYEIARQG